MGGWAEVRLKFLDPHPGVGRSCQPSAKDVGTVKRKMWDSYPHPSGSLPSAPSTEPILRCLGLHLTYVLQRRDTPTEATDTPYWLEISRRFATS